MSLTVSVAGVGKIGEKHAAILKRISDVELGPVVDIDDSQAEEVATQLGTTATTLDEAVANADCLFVCTPDDQHTKIALRAIDEGLHTFVEKPLSTTTADTERLRSAAERSDATHMVGHVLRFDPRYRTVHDSVDAGQLGDVVSVVMQRFVKRARIRRTGPVSPPWMRLGVHDFDLLEWLFDTDVRGVRAVESEGALTDEGYDIDEAVSVLAELTNGATATLTMGFCLPDGHQGSHVHTVAIGTEGAVSVDASGDEVQRWDGTAGTSLDTHLWPDVDGVPDGALARQDRAFVRAIREAEDSPVPFSAGHRSVRIAEAVENAVEGDGRVTI